MLVLLSLECFGCISLDDRVPAIPDGASRLHGFQCDVSQPSEIKNCVEHVCKTIGKISVLVNSAGVNADHLLITAPDDLIHDLIKTNLIGSINTCRAVLKPMMRQKSGCIINIGTACVLIITVHYS